MRFVILSKMITEYFTISTLWTLVLFVVILLVTRHVTKLARLPPGPWGLPFIGYAMSFENARRPQQITALGKHYRSKVITISLFGNIVVFVMDYQLVKTLFQKRTDLVDRIEYDFFELFDKDYKGIIGASGPVWKEQRRFTIYMLRDFGMGKLTSETYIQNETSSIMDLIASYDGKAFDPINCVNMAVSNVINSMVFGKRFEYDNEKFCKALFDINEVVRQFSSPSLFFLLRTSLGKLIMAKKYNQLQMHFDGFSKFVTDQIEEHKKRYDGTVNDFIDGYLKEMENGEAHIFNEKHLQSVILDLFIAGSETTSTTLRWALLHLAFYPEIQENVYKELKNVLDGRLPSMNDRRNTPYTEATLSEIQRLNTLVPFGLGRTCSHSDFEVEGYIIPQGAPVVANLHHIHTDPEFWKYPDTFNPDNFLDDDGQVTNLDRLVPFSLGRRSCAGESLARMELYIFFSSWVQRFRVQLVTPLENLGGDYVGVYQPKHYQIRMVERKK